jgi:hypothetical protein
MRILKLLLVLGSIAGATSITSAVGGNPNPLLTTGDIWAGTTNGAPTNLPAGASGTFLGSNGIGIAPTYQLINYSSLTGTVPTWNQSTTGSAATLTTPRAIATSGDAVGTATSFNGSANISIPTTVSGVNGATVPLSKTIVGTNGTGQIVDASAATLANNTTGNAATATKWQTARNLTIGSSTQAQDGTAALTYSLAAIGAMPLWSTSNAIPKGDGSTGLTASSWTDSASVLRTTTTDTLVAPRIYARGGAWSIGQIDIGTTSQGGSMTFRRGSDGTATGWLGFGSATTATDFQLLNLGGGLRFTVNAGDALLLDANKHAHFYGSLYSAGPDTIANLLSKTIIGTDAGGQVIDNSATTLANNTTGSAAKWTTARNLTIGSSTQAQDGTAALTYSLAAIGAQAAGSYMPLNPVGNTQIAFGNGTTIQGASTLTYNGTGALYLNSTDNSWRSQVTGQPTDGKYWDIETASNLMNFRLINDVQSSANTFLQFARSGTSILLTTLHGPFTIDNPPTSTGSGPGIWQQNSAGSAITASYTVPAATTFSAPGTAINASNGDISTGGEIILTSSISISGAGVYTQPFATTNAIQYYDGGGTFMLTAPSASGLAGKRFAICDRAASIIGFPTGANAYYTAPGAAVALGHCVEALSDGTKWHLLP